MAGRPRTKNISASTDWWWIFDPRSSLRARAALTIAAGGVAFTLLLSWITGILYRRSLEHHLSASFETLAFQIADKLDRSVYERYRTLQLASNLNAIREREASPADRRRLLEALQETSPEFAWIGLTDEAGRIVAATNRVFEETAAANRAWFLAAREGPSIGPLHEMPELVRALPTGEVESNSRFLDIALPMTGSNGKFAGVLAAHVRWTWSREVQLSVVPENAARDRIGVTVYSAGREVLLDSGVSGWTQPPEAPSVGEGRRFRGAITETTSGGSTYLSGFSRSRGAREYRGIGWLTVVRQPIHLAFADVRILRRNIFLWGSVLTVAASIAGWIAAGRHARRLRSVRAAAERIREGDILTVLPRPRDESEIAGMCAALDDLVEDLRTKQEKLAAENTRLAAQLRENEAAKR